MRLYTVHALAPRELDIIQIRTKLTQVVDDLIEAELVTDFHIMWEIKYKKGVVHEGHCRMAAQHLSKEPH